MLQQRLRFRVGFRGGADDDVHTQNLINLIKVDLWEHDVLFQAHSIVAAPIKRRSFHAVEVARWSSDCGGR